MKKTPMSYVMLSALLFFALFTFASCEKDSDTPDDTIDFAAVVGGGQETPPVSTAGNGTLTATYNATTNLLSYTLTWTSLTGPPTAMHFHKAPVGVAGGVVNGIDGFSATAAGTLTATATIDETEEMDLMEGKFYVNIHTDLYPGGEIRGQLIKQ